MFFREDLCRLRGLQCSHLDSRTTASFEGCGVVIGHSGLTRTPFLPSRFCFGFDMFKGKWRILQGVKGHSQVTDFDEWTTFRGIWDTKEERTDASRTASDSATEGPFLPGQSVGNVKDCRSQCVAARRRDVAHLKEMKSKAARQGVRADLVHLQRSQLMT